MVGVGERRAAVCGYGRVVYIWKERKRRKNLDSKVHGFRHTNHLDSKR